MNGLKSIKILAEHYQLFQQVFLLENNNVVATDFLIHPEFFDLAICLN